MNSFKSQLPFTSNFTQVAWVVKDKEGEKAVQQMKK